MKRGQISIEFISIFGFIFLMMIPLIIIFFDQSGAVQDAIARNHLRNIGIKLADEAETIYYLGEPSKTTLKTHFPDKVEQVIIGNRSIIFRYRTLKNTLQDIVIFSVVNVTGDISPSPGVRFIKISASGGEVVLEG